MRCPSGHPAPNGAVFCTECGQRMRPPVTICPNGHEMPIAAAHCTGCGAPLSSEAKAEPAQESSDLRPDPPGGPATAAPVDLKGRSALTTLAALAAVFVILVGGVWWVTKGSDSDKAATPEQRRESGDQYLREVERLGVVAEFSLWIEPEPGSSWPETMLTFALAACTEIDEGNDDFQSEFVDAAANGRPASPDLIVATANFVVAAEEYICPYRVEDAAPSTGAAGDPGTDGNGVRYGAEPSRSGGPEFCPPPLSALSPNASSTDGSLRTWSRLGGDECYGDGAPYQHCGDRYRDGAADGDCQSGSEPSGMAESPSEDSRRADAARLNGGECFVDGGDRNEVILVDCALDHDGEVDWGTIHDKFEGLGATDPEMLEEACTDYAPSDGSSRMIEAEDDDGDTQFACLVYR